MINDLHSLVADPRYLALPEEARSKAVEDVAKRDTRFLGLPDHERAKVMTQAVQWKAPTAPTKPSIQQKGPSPTLSHEVPSYSLDTLTEMSKPITQDDKLTGMAQKKQQYQADFQEAKKLSMDKIHTARMDIDKQLKDPKITPTQRRDLQIKGAAMSDYVQSLDTNIVDALGDALPLAPIKLQAMVTRLASMAKGGLAHLGEVLGKSEKARQQAVDDLIDHGHSPEHAEAAVNTVVKTTGEIDKHTNAELKAHDLMQRGASKKEVEAAIKKNPLVGEKMEAIRQRRAEAIGGLKEEGPKTGEVLPPEAPRGPDQLPPPKAAEGPLSPYGAPRQPTPAPTFARPSLEAPKPPALGATEHIEAAPAPKDVEPLYTPEHHTTLKTGEPVVYFHQSTPTGHVIHAENPDTGEHLGKVEFSPHRTEAGKWEGLVHVQESHRGKGVASGLYQHAEDRMGLEIAPSIHQTEAGKAFTAARMKAKEEIPPTNTEAPPSIFPAAPSMRRTGRRRMGYPEEGYDKEVSAVYKGERGVADPALLLHITGAAGGAALDPNHPLEGAALGLSITGLAHFGVGRFAKVAAEKNLDLSALAEKYKPNLTTITNTKQLSDAFFWARASSHADSAVIAQHIDSAVKDGVTKGIDKMFRDASEGSIKLNPKGQALYDKTVQPLRDVVNSVRAKYGKAADVAIRDLGTRIALNHRTWLDALMAGGEQQARGGAQRLFAGKPGAAKARTVFSTDDGHIVTTKKNRGSPGYSVTFWKDGEVVGTRQVKTKPGEGSEIGDVKLRQAKQRDIEQHSPVRYVQSDLAVWGLRAKEMLKYDRDQELLKGIINSKDPDGISLFPHVDEGAHNIPENYRQLSGDAASIPQFQGRFMPSNLAEVIEDEAKAGKSGIGNLVNDVVIKSMMVNFVPHAMNEFVHWWDARGISGLLTPKGIPMGASKGWYGFAKTFPDAMKSVITMDKFQTDLMRHGGALMAPSRREAANMDRILQYGMKEAMKSGSMREIAQAVGMSPFRLMKKISDGSSAIMWGLRDIFYTQLVKEQMLMGKEMRDAVQEVDRHMPSYRIPPRVLGSRKVSQTMQSPLVVFSAYHHNMLSSLGEMAKEIASPVVKGHKNEFVKGLDRTLALTAAMAVVFPAMDSMLTASFGKPGEEIKQRRAGPMHPIEGVQKIVKDPTYENVAALGMGILTPSPMLVTTPELMFNRNVWSGKRIMKPGTEVKDAARYIASKLHPVDVAAKVQEGKQSTEAALLSALDILTKTRKQKQFEENLIRMHERQRRLAARK